MTFLPTLGDSSVGVNGLAICALVVSTISACTAIANFILTRVRLPKVRFIKSAFSVSAANLNGRTEMTVDVLNSGASIWDLQVTIEIWVPPWEASEPRQAMGYSIVLPPVGEQINPLNSGQAQEFLLTDDFFIHHHAGQRIDSRDRYVKILKKLPAKYVSLCIWSNDKRMLLKRIKSRHVRFQCYSFFGIRSEACVPWRSRLAGRVFRFAHSARGEQLAKKLDKWRPGWFKLRMEQLESWLRGEVRQAGSI